MYKIREDVDLKELEKYGFECDTSSRLYERKIDNKWWDILYVNTKDRTIFEMTEEIGYWVATSSDEELFDTTIIDDLIKADLVVKVEE